MALTFLEVLNKGGVATSVYLASVQAMAIETGLISHPILPKRMWPKHQKRAKRSVTSDEHCRLKLNSCEKWSAYLELLWQTGASQSDAAQFRIELADLKSKVITYRRLKTNTRAAQKVSDELAGILQSLAGERQRGYFIPTSRTYPPTPEPLAFARNA